jgi:hypothetical protein
MEVVNILNEHSYTVRVDESAKVFQAYQMVFGGLVPWDGVWYWSGTQHGFEAVTEAIIEQLKQEFPRNAPRIVYRYCDERAEKAREFVRDHYQGFVDYFGNDLVVYADGATMAADMQAFLEHQNASKPQEMVAEFLEKHHRSDVSPRMSFPPDLLEAESGVAVYFNPDEGQEMMWKFDDVISGFQKRGSNLREDEFEMIREFISSDAISPNFVRRLVQEYGHESIASAFLIPQDVDKCYLEYLLHRHKGHFYRNRYPSITLV